MSYLRQIVYISVSQENFTVGVLNIFLSIKLQKINPGIANNRFNFIQKRIAMYINRNL